jgi:hypothetical protein
MDKRKLLISVCFVIITAIISLSFGLVISKSKANKNVNTSGTTAKLSSAATSSGNYISTADSAKAKNSGNILIVDNSR